MQYRQGLAKNGSSGKRRLGVDMGTQWLAGSTLPAGDYVCSDSTSDGMLGSASLRVWGCCLGPVLVLKWAKYPIGTAGGRQNTQPAAIRQWTGLWYDLGTLCAKNGLIFWGLGAVNHPQMASFGRCRMGGFGWEVVVTHENVLQFGWYML